MRRYKRKAVNSAESSTQLSDNSGNQPAQDVQPESGAERDPQAERDLRQSAPDNPRVADKSMEATEEA